LRGRGRGRRRSADGGGCGFVELLLEKFEFALELLLLLE
jgi:hypothetical protein